MQAEGANIFNAITECNRKFMSAFHQSDSQGIAEPYSKDAKLSPPGSPPVSGRSTIEGYWDEVLQQRVPRLEFKTMELEHLGHTAIEIRRAHTNGGSGSRRRPEVFGVLVGRWQWLEASP